MDNDQDRAPVETRTWYGPYGARPGLERPDEDIRSDIIDALRNYPMVDLPAINVTLDEGVVTLSGEVESEDVSREVGNIVFDMPGIVDVHNYLQVRTPGDE